MIVPQRRLTRCVVWFLAPGSVLAALLPNLALLPPILFGSLLLAVLVDLLLGLGRLDSIRIACEATSDGKKPAILRGTRGGTFAAALEITPNHPGLSRLNLAVEWPNAVRAHEDVIDIDLSPGERLNRVTIQCDALRRGLFHVRQCVVETPAPLGFLAIRRVMPLLIDLRIYPDLTQEKKQAPAMFLSRGGLGVHPLRQIGKGREFETLREYIIGDTYADIHWKATARKNRPITKVFQIERTQEIYVILDASRLSNRRVTANPAESNRTAVNPTPDTDRNDYLNERYEILDFYIRAAMVLQLAASRQNDLFGLGMFSDKMDGFIRSGVGPAHQNRCRNMLFHLRARQVTPDFLDSFSFLRMKLRRRALLIFLTSLDDPGISDHFVRHVETLSGKHLVVVGMMRSDGVSPLFNDPVESVSGISRALSGHIQWQKLNELDRVLRHKGVQCLMLDHPRMTIQLIERYMQIKQRQLL